MHRLRLEANPRVNAARRVKLHPIQCVELMALFYAVLKSRERPPKLVIGKTDDRYQVFALPPGGLSGRSPYRPWDEGHFHKILIQFFRQRFEIELRGRDDHAHAPTFLLSSRGEPIQAPNAEWMPEVWDDPRLLG